MKNLKLLKGTEKELGKLSAREDYAKNEREQIKKLVDIAKDKYAADVIQLEERLKQKVNSW